MIPPVMTRDGQSSSNVVWSATDLSDDPRTWGLSLTTATGLSPLGDEFNNPQESALTTIQVLDTLTWTRGAHLIKTGVDLRFTRQNGFRDVQSRGFLTFSDFGFTGNALADMLLGLPVTTGGALSDNPQRLRTQSYNVFIQDDLQLTPDLTVSAGLRYEINTPPVDADDLAAGDVRQVDGDLAVEHGEALVLLGCVCQPLISQGFNEQADRCEGRPQLVGDRGQKVILKARHEGAARDEGRAEYVARER